MTTSKERDAALEGQRFERYRATRLAKELVADLAKLANEAAHKRDNAKTESCQRYYEGACSAFDEAAARVGGLARSIDEEGGAR